MRRTSLRTAAIVTGAAALAVLGSLAVGAGRAAAGEAGALPAVIHCSDTAQWSSAKYGREQMLKAAGVKDALVLSAGGSLSAAGAPAGAEGRFPVRMLETAGFDVVNLAHRDLAGPGAAVLLPALGVSKSVKFVSANLAPASGAAPWKPWVVVERGGRSVAVIGVAWPSRALELPGALLLEGLTAGDPEKALERALGEARGKAAHVVLLADAPPAEVKRWLERFKEIDLALVSARGGAPMRMPGQPRLLGAPSGGGSLSLVTPAGGGAFRATELLLLEPGKLSAEYRRAAGEFKIATEPVALVKPAGPGAPAGRPLAGLRPGVTVPVSLKTANRAAQLEATSVLVAEQFGAHKAAAGKLLLVVAVRWENILKPQVVREKKLPVAYLMKQLSDHLYLVLDGRTVVPGAPVKWPDQIGPGEFLLPTPGSVRTGRLVYEIPTDAPEKTGQVQLRLYDYAHGNAELTLVRTPEFERLAAPKPVFPPAKNELVELAVFGTERAAEIGGKKAPAGCEFLSLDLRSRSCLVFKGDATAYDPKAQPGEEVNIGTVCDWKDWERYLCLVVDGAYAAAPERELSAFQAVPRFLPDILTGGRVVFAVPNGAKSLRLRFDYPHAATPDQGVIAPKPLALDLLGKPPAPGEFEAAAEVTDEQLQVKVAEGQALRTFNGILAGSGSMWYVAEVSVTNGGEKQETIQTGKQFEFVKANGGKQAMAGKAFGAAYGPARLVLVPPGETRRFRAAWLVPESEKRPRIGYNGYSLAKTFEMKPVGELVAGAGGTEVPKEPQEPQEPKEPKEPSEPVAAEEPKEPEKPEKPEVPAKAELREWKTGRSAGNRAFDLTVESLATADKVGKQAAGSGLHFLVAETVWKRRIGEEEYGKLGLGRRGPGFKPEEQLFCVVNGNRLLSPASLGEKGVLAQGYELSFEKPGETKSGRLVWTLPDTLEVRSAELCFYDPDLGNFELKLIDDPKLVAAKPVKTAANEVLGVGLYSFRLVPGYGRHRARKGQQFAVLDVGFVSRRTRSPAMPQAGGAGAADGAVPAELVWKAARDLVQLVVDGTKPIPLGTDISGFGRRDPVRLPAVMTRHELVFAVPEKLVSLDLQIAGNSVVLPGKGPVLPAALNIPLHGQAPGAADFQPAITLDDDGLKIMIAAPTFPEKVGDYEAGRDSTWLAVDGALENIGSSTQFIDIRERIRYVRADREPAEFDSRSFELSAGGLRRGEDWLPPGGRRRFRMVWQIPSADKTPRLYYFGTLENTYLDLVGGRAHNLQTGDQVHIGKTRVFHPELKPKGIEGVGLKPEDVNRAIDRGRDFLWKYLWTERLNKGRGQVDDGEDILSCLALVHCDAHRKYPEFDSLVKRFLREVQFKDFQTYEVALVATLVEHYGDPAFEPVLRQATRWMLETQGPNGTFGYHASDRDAAAALVRAEAPSRPSGPQGEAPAAPPVIEVQGGVPVEEESGARPAGASWARRSDWSVGDDGDNSITQFAMLGLWAANRSRLTVDPSVWRQVLARTRDWQCDDDGWAYSGRGSAGYGSMTCAGICTLAICLEHLGRKPLEDLGVQRGLRWLIEKKWNYAGNTKHDKAHHYYYIYSIERVGRILDIEFIGDQEWYPLGAKYLVGAQRKNGSWPEGDGESVALRTSFALLFLTRATPSFKPKPKPKEGDGTLLASVSVPAGTRYYVILDASGSMLSKLGGKAKLDIAREAVTELMARLPEGSEVALRVYGNRQRAIDMEGRLNQKANTDSTLELPMGRLDRSVFAQKLAALRAVGKTPLAHSLGEAAGDMGGLDASEEKPVHVVLLTDGGEDTQPRGDPVAAAGRLAKLPGVKLDIVGFDIGRKDWQDQLEAMSRAAGTQYWSAAKPELLSVRLQNAALQAPEGYKVLDAKGTAEVAGGQFGVPLTLRQGKYVFQTEWKGRPARQEFWVNTGSVTAVRLNVGELEKLIRGRP